MVAFAEVGVQRDRRPVQHPEQRPPVRVHPLEHAVDAGEAGPSRAQRVEAGFQIPAPRRLRLLPIGLQILV
jgi:hypothetical protein